MTAEPGADTPATGTPATGTPVTDMPVTGTPVTGNDDAGTPVTDTPGAGTPVTGTPVSGDDGAAGGESGDDSFSAGVSLKGSLREAMSAPPTVYEIVGGRRFFDELVDRFYDAVTDDPQLRPMYPRDMGPSRRRLAGFLAQYWGGPPHYSEERGHPRLRMRHFPFAIGQAERDAWMAHMTASLDAATIADGTGRPLPAEIQDAMFDHFDDAATHLVNQPPG